MKRLRFGFAVFSILLSIPVGILLWRTYSNLESEAFYFYRSAAQGAVEAAHQRLLETLQREEERPYTHYRYIHVADSPLPQQAGLNLSPLAAYPISSEIPGILGYFQVDPDGTFQTPLLPADSSDFPMPVPMEEERQKVKARLEEVVGLPRTHARMSVPQKSDADLADSTSRMDSLGKLKKNLESNFDLRLDKEYSAESGNQALAQRTELEEESKDELFQRRVQKASPKQAEVFESQLLESPAFQLDDSLEEGSALERGRANTDEYRSAAPAEEVDAEPLRELSAEVDPFTTHLVGEDWLLFQRNVWSQERRYVQGLVADLDEFLEAFLRPTMANSALPDTASYLLFHKGDPVSLQNTAVSNDRPLLLFSNALPHPLSEFHLAITLDRLPRGPGHRTANLLALVLSLFFLGGLIGIYKVTATQMELSQKKADFVSAVSHELKTPLTAIRMYGEMLMEGWVDDEKRDGYYRHIHDESERLSRLIQNVLTLAQLEKSEWQSSLTVEDPLEVTRELVGRLSDQVRRAGFEIGVESQGKTRPLNLDRDALTQIIINLVDNAIKFSRTAETKKILITVEQAGEEVYIRVRDFGPGIPRRQLKRIFEKFYRIDDEMTRSAPGTGIGLALVQMLARSMGGQVDVRNRQPGAEFSLRLPAGPG